MLTFPCIINPSTANVNPYTDNVNTFTASINPLYYQFCV